MNLTDINYGAVLVAAVLGFGFGAIWYGLLAEPWRQAHGMTRQAMQARRGRAALWPLVTAFIADLVMACVLALILKELGELSLVNGVIVAALLWLGFVITTLTVNNSFAMRNPKLIAIDGGHWLGVLLLMGAVIGAWGG